MKINVGDYVRTHGYIDKIININDFRDSSMKYALEQPSWNDDVIFIGEEEITKSSPNIIDLIEVGDYVNGHKVIEVDLDDIDDYGNTFRYIKTEHDYTLNHWVKEYEIESIVTKEQFEAMKYIVKE